MKNSAKRFSMSNRSRGRVLSAILPSCSDSLRLYPDCQWEPSPQQKERSPIPVKYFSAHWQVEWTADHRALPNLEILFLSLSPARLGQKSNALLQTPSQKHLQHHLKIRRDEEEQAVFPTYIVCKIWRLKRSALESSCLSRSDCMPGSYGGDGGIL